MLLRNHSLKILFLATVVCVSCVDACSQLEQPNRFEKEKKFFDIDFTLIPLYRNGLALIREKNEYKSGNRTWEVILLDTALRETEPITFEIANHYNLIGYEHSVGYVYFLFNETGLRDYMSLLAINIK